MKRFLLLTIAVVFLGGVGVAGCGSKNPTDSSQTGPPPATTGTGTGTTGPFGEFDRSARELVTREATWQAPASLTVGETQRIGLAIGEGPTIKQKIDNLLPDTVRTPAGVPVQVGPTMRVTLRANPADAVINPSEAVNASTGSDIQMLWTWLVHPKRPTKALKLTALIEIPLDNGQTVINEIGFSIGVARTFMYTAQEVGTHWGTWSAIVATIISVVGWFIRRRRNKRRGGDQLPPPSAPAAAQQLAA